MISLEIACFSLESAKVASQSQADRIEFCSDYATGGVTPDINDLIELRKLTTKPIYVMIRPRPGNFIYSMEEVRMMQSQIQQFVAAGADGLVFGCLTHQQEIDREASSMLLEAAGNKPCTFHRAIDETTDILNATQLVKQLGFAGILSSGKQPTAIQGAATLKTMQNLLSNQLQLVCGGGIRSSNISELLQHFTPTFIHSAALVNNQPIANEQEINAIKKAILV